MSEPQWWGESSQTFLLLPKVLPEKKHYPPEIQHSPLKIGNPSKETHLPTQPSIFQGLMLNFEGCIFFVGQQRSSCSCQMGKPYIFGRGQRSRLLQRLRLRSSLRSQASHLERLGKRNTKNCDVVASSCKIYMFIFIHRYLLMMYIRGLIWCMCDVFFDVFICWYAPHARHIQFISIERFCFSIDLQLHIFVQYVCILSM